MRVIHIFIFSFSFVIFNGVYCQPHPSVEHVLSSEQRARRDFYLFGGVFSSLGTGRVPDAYPNFEYTGTPFLSQAGRIFQSGFRVCTLRFLLRDAA